MLCNEHGQGPVCLCGVADTPKYNKHERCMCECLEKCVWEYTPL